MPLSMAARAVAAAIFMASLMSVARTSKAPRKMPGKVDPVMSAPDGQPHQYGAEPQQGQILSGFLHGLAIGL